MTTISSVSAASFLAYAARNTADAAQASPAQASAPTIRPAAKVAHASSRAAYDASLNTLRTANKMMMGYLLNIEV